MGFVRLAVSMKEEFAEKLDARVKEMGISRSEYIRHLVIRDTERVSDGG